MKPSLFFGFTRIKSGAGSYLRAEPEKAVLDYLYFNHHRIMNEGDVTDLRINAQEYKERIDAKKIISYAARMNHKGVTRALNLLTAHVTAH
jgi:hypothetical protein